MDPYRHGVTTAEALKRLAEYPNECELLRTTIHELLNVPPGKMPSPRSLSTKLHHLRKRVIAGRFIDSVPRRDGAFWRICGTDSSGSDGSNGSNGSTTAIPTRVRTHARAYAHAPAPASQNTPVTPVTPEPQAGWMNDPEFMDS